MQDAGNDSVTGLDLILGVLKERYLTDARGRLRGLRSGGVPPRFVFGRSAEGSLWRFSSDLEDETVIAVAKLAGRERGWPDWSGSAPAPPDRLVMMARMLGAEGLPAAWAREEIRTAGRLRAEIWSIE
jgi:hypothetical protein